MLNPNFAVLNLSYVKNYCCSYEYKVNKIYRNSNISLRVAFNGFTGVIGYAGIPNMILSTTYDKYSSCCLSSKK